MWSSEANIWSIPVLPALALPLPIALVLAMIEGRVCCCRGDWSGAGRASNPSPALSATPPASLGLHAMPRAASSALVAQPLPHLLQPLPATLEIRFQPALLLDRLVHLPARGDGVRFLARRDLLGIRAPLDCG